MSGFYEAKHAIENVSMDEIQRIVAGLYMLVEIDSNNGNESEADRSRGLIDKIEAQHDLAGKLLPPKGQRA